MVAKSKCKKIINFNDLRCDSFDNTLCNISEEERFDFLNLLYNDMSQKILITPKHDTSKIRFDLIRGIVPAISTRRFEFNDDAHTLVPLKSEKDVVKLFLNIINKKKAKDAKGNVERIKDDPEKTRKNLFNFIKNYGFFFPITDDEYIEYGKMICLIERFSILVDLIHEISLNLDNDNYYQTILALVLKLLLSKPVEIKLQNYTYRSCVHNYYELINGPYHLKTDSSRLGSWGTNSDDDKYGSYETKISNDELNEIFEGCFPEISEKENEETENSKEGEEKSDTEMIEAENSKENKEESDSEMIEAENSKENKEESVTEMIEAENSKESEEESDFEKIKADLNINDVNHVGSLYYQNNALFFNFENLENNIHDLKIIVFMKLYFEQVGIVKGCIEKVADIENVTENCAADKRIVTQLEYVGKPDLKKFTPKMKEALIIIAKKVICDEIEHNIKNIRPSFDLEKGLSLRVNTLLEAMYYSLLLNYKQGQGYRRCTRCYEYFLMSLTDNKRKNCGSRKDYNNKNSKSPASNK